MRETKGRDYAKTYARMTAGIRAVPGAGRRLTLLDRILTGIMYAAYPLMLLYLAVTGWQEAGAAAAAGRVLPYILVPGISFGILSLVRKKIDRQRPYERWEIDPLIYKKTKGNSMPSRHVFSSAVISMCLLHLAVPLGIAGLVVTVLSAFVRVLGGVHYPEDVAVGFLAGILAGSLLWAI